MRVNSGPSAKESDMDLQKMKRFCENLSEPLSLFFFLSKMKWDHGTYGGHTRFFAFRNIGVLSDFRELVYL